MEIINKNLITLQCVMFCFLAGVGCIFPFLPMHMLWVGLDRAEARLVSAVAPFVAILGPAALGCLVDKLSVGRGSTGGAPGPSGSGKLLRVITAVCLILSAIFYMLLLTVPITVRREASRPRVLFMCDADNTYVMQEVCKQDMRCNRWEGVKTGVLAVDMCEYGCADENMTWVKLPFLVNSKPLFNFSTSTTPRFRNSDGNYTTEDEEDDDVDYELYPPHMCYDGKCLVYMQHAHRLRLPLSLEAPEPPEDNTTDSGWCKYRTSRPSCIVPMERLSEEDMTEGCKPAVRCQVLDPYDEPDGVLVDAECRLVSGDPAYTFTIYLVIRIFSDIWPTAALALLGAACVIATRETSLGRGDVGRLLAFGTLGLAIFPPLASLAVESMPENPYLVPFVMHAVFMLIGALILLCDSHMPLSAPEWWWHTSTGVLAMPMNTVRRYGAETAAVFAVVTLLGLLWSGIDAYLPWTVDDLNGTTLEMGLTLTAGALPAVPALWWAEALVDYIGHSNVFITAFTLYCLRYTALAYTTDYTWVVVGEVLEVFTLSLVWVTAVLYFRHLVPRKYTAAGQALPVIAHFCIGRCIGAIVSGMVTWPEPALRAARDVYRALAVCALLAAALYLALYHLLLAPRCAARPVPPPQHLLQGMNTNGSSNGTYSPMRVYHEERSRKGHFRY